MNRIILVVFAVLTSCGQGPIRSSYYPEPPPVPSLWTEILGEPHWRLEWFDHGENLASWEGKPGSGSFPGIGLSEEWASPVLAWPFWPEKNISPGIMRPAGAIFPWDASGERLILGWKQGVDAVFWRELANNKQNQSATGTPRLSWYFDWPRFRELMESDMISEEVRLDPWTADWKYIAQKTVESGFDRRRIRAETRIKIPVSYPDALWIGTSPFAAPVDSFFGEPPFFMAGETPQTWFSSLGLLRIQKEAWVFVPWEGQ